MNNAIQLKQKTFILCTAIIGLAASVCSLLISHLILGNPIHIFSLLTSIVFISAEVIWLAYVFQYQKQQNILLVLALVLISLSVFLDRLSHYSWLGIVVLFPVPILMCVLAVIDCLHGLKRKMFAIIAISICILSEVDYLKNFFYYGAWDWLVKYIPHYIGAISFNLSILLFIIKNRVIPLRKGKTEKRTKSLAKLSPEAALKQLKIDFEYGYITEEEYTIERAKIISEL